MAVINNYNEFMENFNYFRDDAWKWVTKEELLFNIHEGKGCPPQNI